MYYSNILIDAEEFTNFESCYVNKRGKNNKRIMLEGYTYEKIENCFYVFISDFSGEEEIENITKTDIDRLFSNMSAFIEHSLDSYIQRNSEQSSDEYGISSYLLELYKDKKINKFKFYLYTDKKLSSRVKNLKDEEIKGIQVEKNVWDISRFFELSQSKSAKEHIELDFTKTRLTEGIPCLRAVQVLDTIENKNESSYDAYLSVIPGDILSDIYIENGARLLEGNVRSFLSARGKVNKEIRSTILNNPDMFFAYNNGIAATATEIELNEAKTHIEKILNLQIINGGQTTASIANAVINDKIDASNVFVPIKISVVNEDFAETIIPKISRCANNQNKVSNADFFSNSPFHIRIEEISRRVLAPAVSGQQYQTRWFYERARGQHTQEQMNMTNAERKQYLLKNPKNQVLKKVDFAKFANVIECKPYLISKGAEYNMKDFATYIDKEWETNELFFNDLYFKNVVSSGIMYITSEKLISSTDWYKQIKSYRANIVCYTLALIFHTIKEQHTGLTLDLGRIWSNQGVYSELEEQILIWGKKVLEYITNDSRLILNVTEWCKTKPCWENLIKLDWKLEDNFVKTLISKEQVSIEKQEARKERKEINAIEYQKEVCSRDTFYWRNILSWGKQHGLVTETDESLLKLADKIFTEGKVPSDKQCKRIIEIEERLKLEGACV